MNRYIRLIVVACLALVNVSAWGDNVYFRGTVDNNWENPSNWSPFSPRNWDNVYIEADVTYSGDFVWNNTFNLHVNSDVTFTVNGKLTCNNGINLYGNGKVVIVGNVSCRRLTIESDFLSIECDNLDTNDSDFDVRGSVTVHGKISCGRLTMKSELATIVCGSDLNTHDKDFEVWGNVSVGGDISCARVTVKGVSSVLECVGNLDTHDKNLDIEGSVKVGGGISCGQLSLKNESSSLECVGHLDTHDKNLDIEGSVKVGGGISCGQLSLKNESSSLECVGNLDTHDKNLDIEGSVKVGGGISCAQVSVKNESSSLECGGNLDTHDKNFDISGSVTIGGDIKCAQLSMNNNNSSLVCKGDVDTNGKPFNARGSVDVEGDLTGGNVTINPGTKLKVDGEFRANGDVSVSITTGDGTEIIVDLPKDAIKHSEEETQKFVDKLVAAGAYHPVKKYSWTGVKNTDWFDIDNWSGVSELPDKYTDVTIDGDVLNKPIVSGRSVDVRNVTINNGAFLTLKNGACFKASHIYVQNSNYEGAVVIDQSYDNMVSLYLASQIQDKLSAYYNKTIINTTYPTGRYMYVGSETTEGNIETNGAMFYLQDHATDSYKTATSYTNPFNQAGFLAKGGSGTFSVSQTGTVIASGSKTLEVRRWKSHRDGNNWCLLSNPFSFAYPLSSLTCDSKVDPVIWFDNYTGSGYQFTTYSVATHVQVGNAEDSKGALSVGDVIAPQQAFFVRAVDDAPANSVGFLTFNSVPTNYTLSSSSLKSSSIVNDVLRFTISSDESNTDEMAMVFRDGGSLDIIYGDAEKMSLEKTQNQVFAVKGSKRYAIPYYPSVEDASEIEFPIGIMLSSKSTQGKITATNIDMFDESVDVFLYDNLTGNVVNIREENTYQFNEIGGKYISDRFSVVLKYPEAKEEALGNSSLKKEEGSVSVYSADGNIVVRSSIDDARIRVFDICGKVIAESKSAGSLTRIPVSCANGIYLVEVSSNDFIQTSKVLVNK